MTQRPYRILMIAPTSFFGDYGGHIRILEETLALQSLGHTVRIVTYHKGRNLPQLDIRRTPPLPYRNDYEVGSSRHKLVLDLYLALKAVWEGLRMRPDVIHGHMHEGALIGWVLSRLLRVPLVFDFQGSLTGEMVDHGFLREGGWIFRLVHRLERFICRRADATLTSSLRAQTLLEESFGVAPEKITPLPDCVDMDRFDPEQIPAAETALLKERLGIPAGCPVVAYLGFMAPHQGTDHIIQAAAWLQARRIDVHFLVMGFPNVDHYHTLARRHGVDGRMTFTGRVRYDDAPRYLAVGDITISPKLSTTEGSGKVLNYMALGKPVVAYDNPVHQEYLGAAGVYAPAGEPDALAQAIAGLLPDGARRAALGSRLRARAREKYSWTHAGRRIVALYARLRREPPPPRP